MQIITEWQLFSNVLVLVVCRFVWLIIGFRKAPFADQNLKVVLNLVELGRFVEVLRTRTNWRTSGAWASAQVTPFLGNGCNLWLPTTLMKLCLMERTLTGSTIVSTFDTHDYGLSRFAGRISRGEYVTWLQTNVLSSLKCSRSALTSEKSRRASGGGGIPAPVVPPPDLWGFPCFLVAAAGAVRDLLEPAIRSSIWGSISWTWRKLQ